MHLVLDLTDIAVWLEYFKRLPSVQQEIFCRPEYYRIFQNRGMGTATCYIFEAGDEFIMYPFLKDKVTLKPIDKINAGTLNHVTPETPDRKTNYCDIQGAYGYNGVFYNSEDPDLIRSFHDSFLSYCKDSNIIAEFVRFNPVSKNHRISEYMDIIHANNNIIVDLYREDIWRGSYEYSTRKNVNKAKRSGLESLILKGSDISEDWTGIFYNIYNGTMIRNRADEFYFFDAGFFRELASALPANTLFFFILNNKSMPIAAELVLYNEFAGYSFLGGTLSEFYQFRPNDLIKHTIIETLKAKGLRYFCLGGGIEPDDGIFRFKRSFSKNGVTNFYIGKKIHNEEIYNQIITSWELKNPEKKEKYQNFLLKYKY